MKRIQASHQSLPLYVALLAILVTSSSSILFAQETEQTGPATINQSLIQKANDNGFIRVIIRLNADYKAEGQMQNQQQIGAQRANITGQRNSLNKKLLDQGARIKRVFRYIPHLVAEVDAQTLEQMRLMPEVLAVYEDIAQPPLLNTSNNVIRTPTAWDAGYSGEGQTIAIIDTGVDKNHAWFSTGGNKVVSEACYSSNVTGASNSACPNGLDIQTGNGAGVHCDGVGYGSGVASSCNHGTHVAGISAGNPGTGIHFGVARDANIIAIQVFSYFPGYCNNGTDCLLAWNSDMAAGLERVYDLRNSFDISSANMSIGGGQYFSTCDGAVSSVLVDAINNLRAAGIATAVAAGNDGYTSSIGSPACISGAISVGATDDNDDIASFSNNTDFLSLLAPGVSITSSVPGGSGGSATSNYNGTSMAAPHVAGAWAVLKQRNPTLSVSEALNALRTTGTLILDQRIGGSSTIPRIDIGRAYNIIFTDDFETDKGWITNPFSVDLATAGTWERANPEDTLIQSGTAVSDNFDLVSGPLAGANDGDHDIDSGSTTIRSPTIDLAGNLSNIDLSFYYYFSHSNDATPDDYFRVSIEGNVSGTSILYEDTGTNSQVDATWVQKTLNLDSFAGETINIIFEAADESGESIVEAAVDDVLIVADQSAVPNIAPLVDAGPAQSIILPNDATLNGTVSDDGLPASPGSVTTTWSQISGPGTVAFGSATNVDTTASFSAEGSYVLRLTANDGALSNFGDMTVTVSPPTNIAPLVDAGPAQSIILPNDATLNGTASDDGLPASPGSVTTTWSQISGPGTVAFGSASNVGTTASFSAAGSYVLRLTANDGALSSFSDVTVTVNPAPTNNIAPSVDAGVDQSIALPDSVTLNAVVSDDGLPASPGSVTTTWSQISGPGTVAFGSASNVDTTASFSAAGSYVLRLTANDGDLSSFSDVTVTVSPAPLTNIAPSVDAGADQSISLPDNSVTLNGTVSDDGLPASPGSVTTTWSQISGPGTVAFGSASNVDTTASFSAAGSYVLRLTATDGALSNFSEMTVTVSPEPPSTGLVMEVGEATGVGSSWQTITLANTYASMVVVATVEYPSIASLPAVSRIRNAAGNSFDLRVQNPSETNLSGYSVHYFVVEEGLYNQADHGVDMEAVKVVGSSTSGKKQLDNFRNPFLSR